MAMNLGACSPTTTWKKVTTMMPTEAESRWRRWADWSWNHPKTGSSSAAKTGSATHPRARLARVMPNWQALR